MASEETAVLPSVTRSVDWSAAAAEIANTAVTENRGNGEGETGKLPPVKSTTLPEIPPISTLQSETPSISAIPAGMDPAGSPKLQRPASIPPDLSRPVLSAEGVSLMQSTRETHAVILHKRNKSSLSSFRSAGFGSDTLSPAGLASSDRLSRLRAASQDDSVFGGKSGEDEAAEAAVSSEEDSKNTVDYVQLVVMFDGMDEDGAADSRGSGGDDGSEGGNGETEVVDRLTFALVKQEGCEFTFRIVCSYCRERAWNSGVRRREEPEIGAEIDVDADRAVYVWSVDGGDAGVGSGEYGDCKGVVFGCAGGDV